MPIVARHLQVAPSPVPTVRDAVRRIDPQTGAVEWLLSLDDGSTVRLPHDFEASAWSADHHATIRRDLVNHDLTPATCASCKAHPASDGATTCYPCRIADARRRHPSWKDPRNEHSHDLDGIA